MCILILKDDLVYYPFFLFFKQSLDSKYFSTKKVNASMTTQHTILEIYSQKSRITIPIIMYAYISIIISTFTSVALLSKNM